MLFVNAGSMLYANDKVSFKLNKDQKLIDTFSGDIGQNTSVHFIIFKDKSEKDYRIKPFFIDANQQIIVLEEIAFTTTPSVVSYHYKNENSLLTILTKTEDEELHIIDFDINNSSLKRSKQPFKHGYLTLRLQDKSILINRKEEDPKLNIVTILNSESSIEVDYTFSEVDLINFEEIVENKPDVVNTDEFVENGSINESKLYFINNKLVFDYTTDKAYTSLVLNPFKKESPIFQSYFIKNFDKNKDVSSFVYENKSFLFIYDRKNIHIKVYEAKTGENLTILNLRVNLQNAIGKDNLDGFIKDISRNNNKLTGTVNPTQGEKMLITLDYVDTTNYQYNNMMLFQQQMMQMHMNMMNSGPNASTYEMDANLQLRKKREPIEFLLDSNFNISTEKAIPLKKKIDKESFKIALRKNRYVKKESIAYTTSSLRYLYYLDNTESFHLGSKPLD